MHFKTTLVGAALSLSLLPLAARADHDQQQQQYTTQQEQVYQQAPGYQQAPTTQFAEPYPAQPPRGYMRRHGRYEVRAVQQWVEGRYQQVWVPEQCSTRERQRGWWKQTGSVCVPGHYDQRWVPAHYESVQKWVWVPFNRGHHYGRRFDDRRHF